MTYCIRFLSKLVVIEEARLSAKQYNHPIGILDDGYLGWDYEPVANIRGSDEKRWCETVLPPNYHISKEQKI